MSPADFAIPLVTAEETVDQLVANFNFGASTVNVGQSVRFTDTSIGEPISWNWSFDDGTGAEGPVVDKIWDTEGVWTVKLFVRDAAGRESSQSHEITVVSRETTPPPTADFEFRSRTIEVGEVMVFTDTSTGNPDVFVWDFGDGTTGIGSSVEHSFDEPGTYDVQLTVSNSAGNDDTTAQITVISVTSPPEAIIGPFGSRVIETGQSIQFVSESTNSPTAVSWDFGDGATAQGTQAIHSWALPGTYQVRLTVF